MTLGLLVSLSSALLEDDCFLALSLLLNSGIDSGVFNLRPADRSIIDGTDHKNIVDADLLANLEGELFDSDQIVVEHFHLLTLDPDHSEDFLRVRRQSDSLLGTVHVDDSGLFCDRFAGSLTKLPFCLLSLLALKRVLPLSSDLLILGYSMKRSAHFIATLFIQIFEEGTHLRSLHA